MGIHIYIYIHIHVITNDTYAHAITNDIYVYANTNVTYVHIITDDIYVHSSTARWSCCAARSYLVTHQLMTPRGATRKLKIVARFVNGEV